MRAVALTLTLLATGCTQFHAQFACRASSGPEPGAAWLILGVTGALVIAGRPEHVAWQTKVDRCVAER